MPISYENVYKQLRVMSIIPPSLTSTTTLTDQRDRTNLPSMKESTLTDEGERLNVSIVFWALSF